MSETNMNRRNVIGGGLAFAAMGSLARAESTGGAAASGQVHLIARYRALEGKETEAGKVLLTFIPVARKQGGNLYYDLYHGTAANQREFYFVEGWSSQTAFDGHVADANIKQLSATLSPLVDGPADVLFCDRLS